MSESVEQDNQDPKHQPSVTHYFGLPASRFDLLEEIRQVTAVLEGLGIRVHPAGRLKQYERVCDGAAQLWDMDESQLWKDFPAYIHALKEIQELHFIAKAVGDRADACDKLEFLVGGHLLPGDDTDTQARDYQYELLIASLFVNSGLEVKITDPDVHFCWEGAWYYAEAKRPKNVDKVWKAMRKAAKAITAADGQGLVCIALDDVLFGPDRMLRSPTPEMGPHLADLHIDSFVRGHHAEVWTSTKDGAVFGALWSLNLPALVIEPRRLATFRSFQFYNLCYPNDPRCQILRGLSITLRPPL
jgi:hypothetical protein